MKFRHAAAFAFMIAFGVLAVGCDEQQRQREPTCFTGFLGRSTGCSPYIAQISSPYIPSPQPSRYEAARHRN